MASRRRKRRRSCEGKKRFADKNAANRNAYGLLHWKQNNEPVTPFGRLEAYHCQHCGGWHVGHKPGASHGTMRRRKDMPKHAMR